MSDRYGFIIQARMGSKRLPGKSLKKINNIPILYWIINSLQKDKYFAKKKIIVATTKLYRDNIIENYSKQVNVEVFRGKENDVLDRFFKCAQKYNLKNIVRLTSDNPFTETFLLKKLIDIHLKKKNDYTSSKENLPIGIGAEIISFEALKKAQKFSKNKLEREHVCDYVLNNHRKFKLEELKFKIKTKKIKNLRITVDYPKDLAFCRNFFKKNSRNIFRKMIKYDSCSN